MKKPAGARVEFHRFANFPTEIRCKVWQLSISPRIVLYYRRSFHASVPAILHTCREARCEALRSYNIAKADLLEGNPVHISGEHDTILIGLRVGSEPTWDMVIPKFDWVAHRISHLAISTDFLERILAFEQYAEFFERFSDTPILKSMTVVENQRVHLRQTKYDFGFEYIDDDEKMDHVGNKWKWKLQQVMNIQQCVKPEVRVARLIELKQDRKKN